MKIRTTYQTNDSQFLEKQRKLFESRQATGRPGEANYEWIQREGTLLSLFTKNFFQDGGWWELEDQEKIIKCCGAYLYRESLIIGVRYYCFSPSSRYRFAYLNFLLPQLVLKAESLGAKSAVMTFNNYNKSFLKVFERALSSDNLIPESRDLLKGFSYTGQIELNYVSQHIFAYKLSSSRQWYEAI